MHTCCIHCIICGHYHTASFIYFFQVFEPAIQVFHQLCYLFEYNDKINFIIRMFVDKTYISST